MIFSCKFKGAWLIFSSGVLQEGKALYDTLYPSRIIVGVNKDGEEVKKAARIIAEVLQEGSIKKEGLYFRAGFGKG